MATFSHAGLQKYFKCFSVFNVIDSENSSIVEIDASCRICPQLIKQQNELNRETKYSARQVRVLPHNSIFFSRLSVQNL